MLTCQVICGLSSDSCVEEVSRFEGKKGTFILGKVEPALAEVDIEIIPQTDSLHNIQLKTDEKGAFK